MRLNVGAASQPRGGAGVASLDALQVETARLHRENTKLLTELNARSHREGDHSHRSTGAGGTNNTALQVSNAKLARDVSRLKKALREKSEEVERLRAQIQVGARGKIEYADASVQCDVAWTSHAVGIAATVADAAGGKAYPCAGSLNSSPTLPTSPTSTDVAGGGMLLGAGAQERQEVQQEVDAVMELEAPSLVVKPFVPARKQVEWASRGGDAVEPFIRSGALGVVDAMWLVTLSQRGGVIARRQDLPAEAFLGLEDLKHAGCPHGILPLVIVSCPWLAPHHPDPKGYSLGVISRALTQLISRDQRYGVIWDFASLYQPNNDSNVTELTESQTDAFQHGIAGFPTLFTHEFTLVFRVTTLPPEYPKHYDLPHSINGSANTAAYADRGWCTVEQEWATWPSGKINLNLACIAHLADNEMPRNSRALFKLCSESQGRRPPILPEVMKDTLLNGNKSFYNVKDDPHLLARMYDEAFVRYFGSVLKLSYCNLGWTDAEAGQLAALLRSKACSRLEWLHMTSNEIGDEGMRQIAEVLTNGTVPACTTIVLEDNPGDVRPVEAALRLLIAGNARKAWEASSVRGTGSGPT